jgi:hypothetical protein
VRCVWCLVSLSSFLFMFLHHGTHTHTLAHLVNPRPSRHAHFSHLPSHTHARTYANRAHNACARTGCWRCRRKIADQNMRHPPRSCVLFSRDLLHPQSRPCGSMPLRIALMVDCRQPLGCTAPCTVSSSSSPTSHSAFPLSPPPPPGTSCSFTMIPKRESTLQTHG